MMDDEDRFWSRVEVQPNGCWQWTGPINAYGYGVLMVNRFQWKAHRYAWTLLRGPIETGKQLDHDCHNRDRACVAGSACPHRRCVNPAHLIPSTARENLHRSRLTLTAQKAAQTHCIWGHEFTPENTRVRKNGTRNCRICDRTSNLLRVRPSRAKVVV